MRDNGMNVSRWTTEADLSEATVRGFLHGRTRTLGDETYELLAAAASSLLDRNISAAELRGDLAFPVSVPIRHYVGAGDEVYPVDGDGNIDYVDAPPGFEKGQAFVVRGDSMRPVYDDADVLFCRRREPPPSDPTKRAVIVEVKDGPLLVKKLLPGTRKGRYHLLSINPVTAVLADRPVVSIGRIGWVKPVE